jgi:subtilisin-like proprotein convertase family protein
MVMRTGSSDILFRGHRDRRRWDSRLTKARKSRQYQFDLEGLELRTLLATTPAPAPTTSPLVNLSQPMGNGPGAQEDSPLVEVDPLDPQKIVSVWVNNDAADIPAPGPQVFVEGDYSVNGGQSWAPFQDSVVLPDPNTKDPTVPYLQITNPSVSFDRSDNFYVLLDEHNSGGSSGALVLEKYSFTGDAPVAVRYQQPSGGSNSYEIIYQWLPPGDLAFDPTMAVDDNIPTFTDPTTGQVQTDISSGDIYIAWATGTVAPASPSPVSPFFNPNTIVMVTSTDGGQDFSAQETINTSGYGPTTERDALPAITISQGRLPSESGQQGDAGVAGGQVTVGWTDTATNEHQLLVNSIPPGRDFHFDGSTGFVGPGTKTAATITDFPTTVQVPLNQIGLLDSLTVTVDIFDTNDAMLGLKLIAPDGDSITLFTNQTLGGVTNTFRGISGANVGENNGFLVGTTFTDSAARSIVDISPTGGRGASAPYVGDFRVEDDISVNDPDGRTLTAFLNKVLADNAINGTWELETIDSNTSAPSTPSSIDFWTLNLSTGMRPDLDVQVPGTLGLIVAGSLSTTFPTTSAASPIGISPGLVMASDNTLGSFSPYQGRIYAAFVGYFNVKVDGVQNPEDNTDIFLTFSDDGGRTWSSPEVVNNDATNTDGSSAASENLPDIFTGRVQFQPEIAVDPVTGTLVLSWRDGRNDASRSQVATYLTTSIDGGQTFSAQTYANPSQTAINSITGQTVVIGPESDNESGGNSNTDHTWGYGTQMGLAVFNGQIYPVWAGNLNQGHIVNGAVQGPFLSIFYQPMVVADGPRIVSSDMGPISLAEAESGSVSFTVTFDRPINPPSVDGYTTTPTFTPADVLVYYHDTTNGDPSVPLQVTSVTPITASGVGPENRFGYTQFQVTFDSLPSGANPATYNYTGTYSYMILPDDGSGTAISSPIRSFVNSPVDQPVIGPVSSPDVPLAVPTSGTGGSGTSDDITTSLITINNSNYINANVTGITVNMTLDHQRDGDLTITLTAPNGAVTTLYSKPGDNGQNFISTTFSDQATKSILGGSAPYSDGPYQPLNPLALLDGSQVNGTYRLTIDDGVKNNTGTLISWSITVNSSAPTFVLQSGAAMDQNADGTSDENPLTTPFTGLTPGDVYAVPTPQPSVPVTFGPNPLSILEPPFSQNTSPLIVPGPQVISTQVVAATGTVGANNLVLNGTTDSLNVTFDRPMQAGTFTPDQVLQIMGPTGSITGPQFFSNNNVNQPISKATTTAPGMLSDTVTVPDYNGTFTVADVTVSLDITDTNDSNLTATLIAPNGTPVALFSNVGNNGQNFTSTVLDDAALSSIANGIAPFTGTYQPTGKLSSLVGSNASGTWTLQILNSSKNTSGVLVNWSLNITPQITVTPVNPVNGLTSTFQIGFPVQQLSGTYTVQLGPDILDSFGQGSDTSQSAGLDVLRGQQQNGPTTTVRYAANDNLPKAIPAPSLTGPGVVSSTIVVPDNFMVQGDTTSAVNPATGAPVSGLQVQISLTYPVDPDLSATLYYDMGQPGQVSVPLFSSVGNGVTTANFTNTVFDDNATTPIQNGSAPFFATFNPQMPLTAFEGLDAKGTWTLVVTNATSGSGAVGTFNGWSLSFQKPLPTTGLGAQGSDNVSESFTIFTLGQTDGLSSEQWTAVGPAAINGAAGQVSAIAVDPSDASGNTVYVAGASGGIWKTTDFLTTNPSGPTYIPLTDFGPTSGINISSIAIFPRNDDPTQSIIIAATGSITGGEGHTGASGVGFLMSTDGGATWNLLDSTDNVDSNGNFLPVDSASRNRDFVGMTVNKVVVDPKLTPTGQVIIYAAIGGTSANSGIWRSEDTGKTWQLMLAGNATDVILDQDSAIPLNPDSNTAANGNLQIVFAGMEGQGVFMSPNQGQVWSLMTGTVGNPLIVDVDTGLNVNPASNSANPNGGQGRIVLSVPAPTGNALDDAIYAGWLYAAVATPSGGFDGLYMTKDFGQNWVQVNIATLPPPPNHFNQAIPTNDLASAGGTTASSYAITLLSQGNLYLTLSTDPANPNIVYLGSFGNTINDVAGAYNFQASDTGLIRIDTTNIWDAHNLDATTYSANNGAEVTLTAHGPANFTTFLETPGWLVPPFGFIDPTPYLNFIRDPQAPFLAYDSTLLVTDYTSFQNNGAGVTWIPFDVPGSGYQASVAEIDPTTGLPRLIFGNSQGIWSVLDNSGVVQTSNGSSVDTQNAVPDVNRNGNIQLTQFYYGAVQPSSAAAQVAGALFYGAAQDNGAPSSDPNILSNGNLTWNGTSPFISQVLNSSGVGVDQQGSGTVYQYWFPGSGGDYTNFLQANGVGRTFGLLQTANGLPTPDSQWSIAGIANFAINPINSNDIVISSNTGNLFTTSNGGVTWFDVGQPSVFGSPGNYSIAMAYGAPDPNAPEGIGNEGNFIYVGTSTGQIYVTQDGGGSGASNNWINISTGLDGSQIESIITNPTRGSHQAYAVTKKGVYVLADSIPSAANPTPTWVNITGVGAGNIFNLPYTIFGQSYNPTTDPNAITYDLATSLTSIVADWNYAIPNNPANPSAGYHPVLFVSANSGVYMSTDNGQSWSSYPNTSFGAVVAGGYLPHVNVTSLTLSLGNIDANTGMPNLAGPYDPTNPTATPDPDLLLASTFGQGAFAINMGPMLFPSTVQLDPSSNSGTAPDGTTLVTNSQPIIDGLSEITGFGNATRITIVDETPTDATFGQVIGGFDPTKLASTNVAANWTNIFGNFAVQINAGEFTSNGLKTVKIYTTDDAGSISNPVTLQFTLAVSGISAPTPPETPTLELAPYDVTGAPGYTNIPTPFLIGITTPGATVELLQADGTSFSPQVFSQPADPVTGAFTVQFPNPTNQSGTFTVEAVARNSNGTSPGKGSTSFTIILGKPSPPANFRLDPNDDTGIKGDNITSDRVPDYIGTAVPNSTVELFQTPNTLWDTTTADANGNFSVELPNQLTNGQLSLYVEVVDLAGNTSAPSNTITVTIVSVTSDYNGDGYSDPALFDRNTTTNQGQWLVQATTPPVGASPPIWFTSGYAFGPANSVPFQGDFDGDGEADLAYYQLSTATWFVRESKYANNATQGISSFTLGTPNSSTPVVGYFDPNGPDEMAVFTIVNGQGVWSIAGGVTPHTVTFGQAGDIPEPGNYDGLGYDQIAVYRPSTGQFLVLEPNGTTETLNLGVSGSKDLSSLVPVPGAYDNQYYFQQGQAERTEAAVYDPITGVYTILGHPPNPPIPNEPPSPLTPYQVTGFLPGDIPAPADYLGTGSTQPAVFRPSTGQFIGAGGAIIATFGQSGDIPLAAPLSYRMPSSDPPGGTTGTGTTGTGTTGTGTTGTGTTGTGTTGTGTTGTGTTTGTTGTGSTTSSSPPPAQNPGSVLTHPGTSTHKKKVAKPKPKPVVHHKKPVVHHKKVKVVQHHAAKPKVHVVTHKVIKVVKAASASLAKPRTHLVDLALENIHTNLRRSSSKE